MKKILIIEDSKEDRTLFKTKLELEGFEILDATTAQEGAEMIKAQRPDLVLLDLVLSEQDTNHKDVRMEYSGLTLLDEIKHNPDIPNTPVVILTNLGHEPYEDRARKLGADDYLVKSELLPSEVVEHVGHILEERKQ